MKYPILTLGDILTQEEKEKLWNSFDNKDEYYRELSMPYYRYFTVKC